VVIWWRSFPLILGKGEGEDRNWRATVLGNDFLVILASTVPA
jgi:hypothetical protein